jgi:pimeloyl-ACP methyl ester carboxylesterase
VTVVFENGLATSLEEWDAVVSPIAARARTLRYDHRYAPSGGKVSARSVSDVLADLEKLLAALSLKPPYVFVGHSWGGVIARLFAHAHPSDVVGLVFVDATHEAIDSRALALLPAMYSLMNFLCRANVVRRGLTRQLCPPGAPPAYRARIEQRLQDPAHWSIGLRTARAEGGAIPKALAQLRRDCPDLPRIPIHVLTAGGVNTKSARLARDGWKAASARAAVARYTDIPTSGHYMPFDAPEAVINAIVGVLDTAQANLGAACMAQTPRTLDLETQRTAMKKLGFLVGEWSGEASVLRGPGQLVELVQTESAHFKLDGLVLVIEGVGRTKSDGTRALQVLGLVSFDDETETYRMRAFNDGRWLETEIKLADSGNSLSWGFELGEFKTTTVLRINKDGEWTELGELIIGDRPPQKMMELRVRHSSR